MDTDYIRRCPVCERENPPEATRCVCGASLLSVDFSIRGAESAVASADAAPAEAATAKGLVVPALPDQLCPHADCGQRNPPGVARCLYCNRPLAQAEKTIPRFAADALAPPALPAGQRNLPAALASRYTVLHVLPTAGSEADLVLVGVIGTQEQRIVKLYRQGMASNAALLQRLAQTGDQHVVRVYEHGTADGVRFEVMEYCPLGNLRTLLDEGPMSVDRLRELVSELSQGLATVQSLHILHRDLKPENILLRGLNPLSLVLTDFGIASMRLATQHFTGGARTTRYAPPEALTGVLDDKSDWWSLGMIVLEATVGGHPFDAMNEQVVNHYLATKPVDTRIVFHDGLRMLCTGLLLRDPKRRWSHSEVTRWLADDPTLPVPQEGAISVALRPYRMGDSQCTTAVELAATMAKHWDDGCKDLVRGSVAKWIDDELHDHNLLRKLQDVMDRRDASPDWRLLNFLLLAAPEIPAVWQGLVVSRESLLVAARKATQGDAKSSAWLQSLHGQGVLELLGEYGRQEVSAFRQLWLAGLERFDALWNLARAAEDRWSREPKPWFANRAAVVDVAYAQYVQPIRMVMPSVERQHPPVLLAINLPAYVALVRGELHHAIAPVDRLCTWFSAMGTLDELDAIGVMVARQLLPLALEDTQREAKLGLSAQQQESGSSDAINAMVLHRIKIFTTLAESGLQSEQAARAMRTELEELQQTCIKAMHINAASADTHAFRNTLDGVLSASIALQAALDASIHVERINAIWLQPQRVLIGVAAVALLAAFVSAPVAIAGGAVLACGIWLRLRTATQVQALAATRLRSFLRFAAKLVAHPQ